MSTARYVYWQDGEQWLGYFEDFPDYLTQGDTLDDLKAHLTDLSLEFYRSSGVPSGRI